MNLGQVVYHNTRYLETTEWLLFILLNVVYNLEFIIEDVGYKEDLCFLNFSITILFHGVVEQHIFMEINLLSRIITHLVW
jgi:hypothetical protein